MNKSAQNPAKTSQNTNAAVHLVSDLETLVGFVKNTLDGMEKGSRKVIDPPQIKVDHGQNPGIRHCVDKITLELEKIVSIADALIVINHKKGIDELFTGTLETLLHEIINAAETADSAADKIAVIGQTRESANEQA